MKIKNLLIFKRHILLCVLSVFFSITSLFGQVDKLDSLKSVLEVVKNDTEKLSVLLEIASVNKDNLRDSAEAYIYYEKARVLAKKIQDTTIIRNAVYNLGEILLEMEEYNMAITYFDAVKRILIRKGDAPEMLSLVYKNLGEVYLEKGDFEVAINFFDKGIQHAKKINNTYQKALNHLYKSEVYFEQKDYASSERQISKAFTFFKKDKTPMMAYYFRGKLLYKLGDYQSAIPNFNTTIALAESENNITVKSKTLQLLADTYLASGNTKMALDYSKNALTIVDSLNDFNKRVALERIGYIHAFESVMDKNKAQELKDNEEQSKKENKKMIIYGICMALGILIIAFFVYRQNKVMRMVADMRKAQMDLVEKKQQEYL